MTEVSPLFMHSNKLVVQEAIFGFQSIRTENELIVELEKIVSLMHFDVYHYQGQFSIYCGSERQRTLSNLSTRGGNMCADACGINVADVVHRVEQRLTPVRWKDVVADSHAREDGKVVKDGVMVPVHGRSGDTGVLAFLVTGGHHDIDEMVNFALGDIGLTAMYFHEAMTRIIAHSFHAPKAKLTDREIECLHWIANHKSNWAISKILGISEHGVVYYVRRLMWKLDAENRYQAVERAAAYGLI
jgi:LuxR family quorum-sensing transcriptional regulator LasR